MPKYRIHVNGAARTVTADDPQMPLLYALRDELGLRGPKFGCGLGQCGACTVHVDGKAARSCSVPVSYAAGRRVTTLEGLGTAAKPSALQQAFIDEQAVQCGYCINGMVMQAADLLARTPKPSEQQVREALAANLCRCGTHQRIVAAVMRASGQPIAVRTAEAEAGDASASAGMLAQGCAGGCTPADAGACHGAAA